MNKSGIKPVGHRILVLVDNVEADKKIGRIHIPEEVQDTKAQVQHASSKGEVIEVGPEAWQPDIYKKPWAKVGDRVSFARTAGVVMNGDDGGYYRLMNDEDVLAVLEK